MNELTHTHTHTHRFSRTIFLVFLFGSIVFNLSAQHCSPDWNESIESGHVTWTSLPHIGQCGTIEIKKGAILEIKTQVTFGDFGRIYIRPGGTLILRDKLTSCDRWLGVRIFGDGDNKGRLEAYDGSVIEHAVWGISTTEWNNYLGEGEIFCEKTKFINNAVAVMMGTRNGPSLDCIWRPYTANFYDCDFETNNEFRHEKFWAFVTTYNLDVHPDPSAPFEQNHVINGCSFNNLQTNSTYSSPYNVGVVALNGNVDIIYSAFDNLYFGVEARFLCRDFPVFIDGTGFGDCGIGVLNSGMSSPEVTWNYITGISNTDNDVSKAGVVLQDYMTGIKVENNYLSGSSTSHAISIGIYTNTIGTMNNKIRKNKFVSLSAGNIAMGENANSLGGLYYLCNKNSANKYFDFVAYNGYAIRDKQGFYSYSAGDYLATGNTFSQSPWFNFLNISNGGVADYYYAEGQKPISTYGLNLEGNLRGKALHCLVEDELTLEELKAAVSTRSLPALVKNELDVAQNELSYQEHWAQYQQVKAELESMVSSGNELLIKEKKAALLVENEEFTHFASLGYQHALFVEKNIDKARVWLERFNNPTGDYLLAGSYWSTGNIDQALSVLSDISSKYNLSEKQLVDNQRMISIYSSIAKNGESVMQKESFVQELESYAKSKEGKSCFLARTLLRSIGQYYTPILDIPDDAFVENRSNEYHTKDIDITMKTNVFPNPTDGIVVFNLAGLSEKAEVIVTDINGMLVARLPMDKDKSSVSWSTDEVVDGVYFYQVRKGSQSLDSGSFVIQK